MENWWSRFLDSLATRGGAIFLLFVADASLTTVILHMIHHGETNGAMAVTISTIFGNFSGALLMVLTGQDKKQTNGEKNGTTTNGIIPPVVTGTGTADSNIGK